VYTFQALRNQTCAIVTAAELVQCRKNSPQHAMHHVRIMCYVVRNLNLLLNFAVEKATLTASIAVRMVSLRCWVSNHTLPLPSHTAYVCYRSALSDLHLYAYQHWKPCLTAKLIPAALVQNADPATVRLTTQAAEEAEHLRHSWSQCHH